MKRTKRERRKKKKNNKKRKGRRRDSGEKEASRYRRSMKVRLIDINNAGCVRWRRMLGGTELCDAVFFPSCHGDALRLTAVPTIVLVRNESSL